MWEAGRRLPAGELRFGEVKEELGGGGAAERRAHSSWDGMKRLKLKDCR